MTAIDQTHKDMSMGSNTDEYGLLLLLLLLLTYVIKSFSVKLQFAGSPFTKPDIITKPRTTRLMPVKILFTNADSFTPKARSPERERKKEEM